MQPIDSTAILLADQEEMPALAWQTRHYVTHSHQLLWCQNILKMHSWQEEDLQMQVAIIYLCASIPHFSPGLLRLLAKSQITARFSACRYSWRWRLYGMPQNQNAWLGRIVFVHAPLSEMEGILRSTLFFWIREIGLQPSSDSPLASSACA